MSFCHWVCTFPPLQPRACFFLHELGSSPLAKSFVVVGKDISVSHFVVVEALDGLSTAFFANWNGLNPAFDILSGSKIKHSEHFWPATKV